MNVVVKKEMKMGSRELIAKAGDQRPKSIIVKINRTKLERERERLEKREMRRGGGGTHKTKTKERTEGDLVALKAQGGRTGGWATFM